MKEITKRKKVFVEKQKEYGMENCKFCNDTWRYNFENELESSKPQYLMSVWFNKKSILEKITKIRKKDGFMRNSHRDYICIDCALSVNESLMKHLRNFNRTKRELEDQHFK